MAISFAGEARYRRHAMLAQTEMSEETPEYRQVRVPMHANYSGQRKYW
jgi:hypothetical protein